MSDFDPTETESTLLFVCERNPISGILYLWDPCFALVEVDYFAHSTSSTRVASSRPRQALVTSFAE